MKLSKGARLVGMSILPGPEDGQGSEPSTSVHPEASILEITQDDPASLEDDSDEDDLEDVSTDEELDAEDTAPVEVHGPWLLLVTSKVRLGADPLY